MGLRFTRGGCRGIGVREADDRWLLYAGMREFCSTSTILQEVPIASIFVQGNAEAYIHTVPGVTLHSNKEPQSLCC